MDRLTAMEAFVRVADVQSFTEAARQWGRSKAVVSKYVGQLEAHLGVTLLKRTTRLVALTDAGRVHYDNSVHLLSLLEESETQLRADQVSLSGVLRVSVPPGLLSMGSRSLLVSFLRQYPNVELDVDITFRMVDLVEERVDIAVRVTQPKDSSLIARRIADAEAVLVAAPSYLEEAGMPESPEALTQHQCLIDQNFTFQSRWPFCVAGRRFSVAVRGPARANDPFTIRDLAVEGLGVALISRPLIQRELASQRLLEILPGMPDMKSSVYAITSQRRQLPARTRAFIEHLKKNLPATLASPLERRPSSLASALHTRGKHCR